MYNVHVFCLGTSNKIVAVHRQGSISTYKPPCCHGCVLLQLLHAHMIVHIYNQHCSNALKSTLPAGDLVGRMVDIDRFTVLVGRTELQVWSARAQTPPKTATYSSVIFTALFCIIPVKNEVRSKEHVHAELISLAHVPPAGYLICQSTQSSAWHEDGHLTAGARW